MQARRWFLDFGFARSRTRPGMTNGNVGMIVITGLVPVISLGRARPCHTNRDGRDKPGHDSGDAIPARSSFRDGRQRRTRNPDAGTTLVSGFRVRVLAHAPRNDQRKCRNDRHPRTYPGLRLSLADETWMRAFARQGHDAMSRSARDEPGHDVDTPCPARSSFRDGASAPDPESRCRHDTISGFRVRVLAHAPRNDKRQSVFTCPATG